MTKAKTSIILNQGKKYIPISDCGIDPLVIIMDGILVHTFDDGDKRVFLLLDDAIAWHEKEIAETKRLGFRHWPPHALERLRKCRDYADRF